MPKIKCFRLPLDDDASYNEIFFVGAYFFEENNKQLTHTVSVEIVMDGRILEGESHDSCTEVK